MSIKTKDEIYILDKIRELKKMGFGKITISAHENKNQQVKLTIEYTTSDVFFANKELKFDNETSI